MASLRSVPLLSDAVLLGLLKQSLKRDNTTKMKALAALKDAFSDLEHLTAEDLLALMDGFSTSFQRLSAQSDPKVKCAALEALQMLLSNLRIRRILRKHMAPLKRVIPGWLMLQCDTSSAVRMVAIRSFEATFPESKRLHVLESVVQEIMDEIQNALLGLEDESRVHSAARCLIYMMNNLFTEQRMSSEETNLVKITWEKVVQGRILTHDVIRKFIISTKESLRKTFYWLFTALLEVDYSLLRKWFSEKSTRSLLLKGGLLKRETVKKNQEQNEFRIYESESNLKNQWTLIVNLFQKFPISWIDIGEHDVGNSPIQNWIKVLESPHDFDRPKRAIILGFSLPLIHSIPRHHLETQIEDINSLLHAIYTNSYEFHIMETFIECLCSLLSNSPSTTEDLVLNWIIKPLNTSLALLSAKPETRWPNGKFFQAFSSSLPMIIKAINNPRISDEIFHRFADQIAELMPQWSHRQPLFHFISPFLDSGELNHFPPATLLRLLSEFVTNDTDIEQSDSEAVLVNSCIDILLSRFPKSAEALHATSILVEHLSMKWSQSVLRMQNFNQFKTFCTLTLTMLPVLGQEHQVMVLSKITVILREASLSLSDSRNIKVIEMVYSMILARVSIPEDSKASIALLNSDITANFWAQVDVIERSPEASSLITTIMITSCKLSLSICDLEKLFSSFVTDCSTNDLISQNAVFFFLHIVLSLMKSTDYFSVLSLFFKTNSGIEFLWSVFQFSNQSSEYTELFNLFWSSMSSYSPLNHDLFRDWCSSKFSVAPLSSRLAVYDNYLKANEFLNVLISYHLFVFSKITLTAYVVDIKLKLLPSLEWFMLKLQCFVDREHLSDKNGFVEFIRLCTELFDDFFSSAQPTVFETLASCDEAVGQCISDIFVSSLFCEHYIQFIREVEDVSNPILHTKFSHLEFEECPTVIIGGFAKLDSCLLADTIATRSVISVLFNKSGKELAWRIFQENLSNFNLSFLYGLLNSSVIDEEIIQSLLEYVPLCNLSSEETIKVSMTVYTLPLCNEFLSIESKNRLFQKFWMDHLLSCNWEIFNLEIVEDMDIKSRILLVLISHLNADIIEFCQSLEMLSWAVHCIQYFLTVKSNGPWYGHFGLLKVAIELLFEIERNFQALKIDPGMIFQTAFPLFCDVDSIDIIYTPYFNETLDLLILPLEKTVDAFLEVSFLNESVDSFRVNGSSWSESLKCLIELLRSSDGRVCRVAFNLLRSIFKFRSKFEQSRLEQLDDTSLAENFFHDITGRILPPEILQIIEQSSPSSSADQSSVKGFLLSWKLYVDTLHSMNSELRQYLIDHIRYHPNSTAILNGIFFELVEHITVSCGPDTLSALAQVSLDDWESLNISDLRPQGPVADLKISTCHRRLKALIRDAEQEHLGFEISPESFCYFFPILATKIYISFLHEASVLARNWYSNVDRGSLSLVNNLTSVYFSPVLIRHEMNLITQSNQSCEGFRIRAFEDSRLITAESSENPEVTMKLSLGLPKNHPLTLPKVSIEGTKVPPNV